MNDPVRLLDDSGTPPALRGLLSSAQGDGPSAADLMRLAGKLGPLLVVAAPVGAAAATAASGGAASAATGATSATATGATVATGAAAAKTGAVIAGVSLLKVSVVAAIGGTVLVAGSFQAGRSYQSAQRPPAAAVSQVVVAPPPAVVKAPVAPLDVEPEPVEEPANPAPVVAAPTVRPPRPQRAATPVTPEAEVALLEQALAAMGNGDAAAALALTARHARDYPQGLLVQEREMLAIEALVKVGKKDEAQARAAAFRRQYPTSSHLLRLDSLVGRPAP